MGIYVFIEAILGIIAGILLALFTKKADGITEITAAKGENR
jgi:energy-converting hydrogenase Eha subunit A